MLNLIWLEELCWNQAGFLSASEYIIRYVFVKLQLMNILLSFCVEYICAIVHGIDCGINYTRKVLISIPKFVQVVLTFFSFNIY